MNDFYLEKWAGDFGDNYTKRCDVEPKSREPIFKSILDDLNIETVLEVGCNKGHNLEAITNSIGAKCIGLEPNKSLCNNKEIINGDAYNIPFNNFAFDLVFTSGVLIHIPPEKIELALSEIHRCSKRLIMMIEYFSKETKAKKYRDFNDVDGVWSRDYGALYSSKFNLDKLIKTGDIKDHGNDYWGFSDCKYWIFEKA